MYGMNGLSVDDYENGLRRLSVLMRRMSDEDAVTTEGTVCPDRMVRRNVCVVCGHTWEASPDKRVPSRCPSCKSGRWNAKDLRRHTCRTCGHRWMSRKEHPLRCPSCRSKLWDDDVRKYRCSDCGFEQDLRSDKKASELCPSCGSHRWGYEYTSCMCKRCGYIGLVPNGGIGRCPSCKSTLSPYTQYDAGSDEGDQFLFTNEIRNYLESLGPGDEVIGTAYLIDHGFDSEDASIVMSYLCGSDEVSIAIERDVSVQRVLSVVTDIRLSGLGRSMS